MRARKSLPFAAVTFAALATSAAAAPTTSGKAVPQFALDYAPIVYIDSQDLYQPSDIGAQIVHTHVNINGTAATGVPSPLTLNNLDSLNSISGAAGGHNVYLASNDDFSKNPMALWFYGEKPDASGKSGCARSCAIIVNEKANGITDVFYMYFYAYNQGNTVLEQELGDHIGDWEHNMIRFQNGKPTAIWYSEHEFGQAFNFSAVAKYQNTSRPVVYSGKGTHANWATAGSHDHNIFDPRIPPGLIIDQTSQGPRWDPTLSAYYYSVSFNGAADGDSSNPTFSALLDPTNSAVAPAPVGWLYFTGQWGDQQLPITDRRQRFFFGFWKYTSGPTGPRDKQLNRQDVCPSSDFSCTIRTQLEPGA